MRFLGILFIFQGLVYSQTCLQELALRIAKDNNHFVQFSKLMGAVVKQPSSPQALMFADDVLHSLGTTPDYEESLPYYTAELNVPRTWVRTLLSGKSAQTARAQTRLQHLIEKKTRNQSHGYYLEGRESIKNFLNRIEYRDLKASYFGFILASVLTRIVFPVAIANEAVSERIKNDEMRRDFLIFFGIVAAVACTGLEVTVCTVDYLRSFDHSKFFTQVNSELSQENNGKIIYQGFDLEKWHFDFMFEGGEKPRFAFFVSE